MGTLTKTFVIINLVFSVAFVMVSATALSQRTHWRQEYETEKKNHETDKGIWDIKELKYKNDMGTLSKDRDKADALANRRLDQLTDLQTSLKEKIANIEKLEKDLTAANAHADRLSQDVDRLAKDLSTTQKELDRFKETLTATRTELDECKTTLAGSLGRLAAKELMYTELLHRFNIATDRIHVYEKYEGAVQRISEIVDRQAKTISSGDTEEEGLFPPMPIHAAVRAVNVEIGLVVLNVGSENNPPVKKGYRFLIYRGGEFIAAVRVIRVEKDMCATEVVPPPTLGNAHVQVGDEAMTDL